MTRPNSINTASLPSALQRATVSAAYPLFMLNMGVERGLNDGQLLAGSGLSRDFLSAADARVTVPQYRQVAVNLLFHTHDPSIGIELGLRSSLTKIGMIGFGLMSCNTLREAIALGLRFLPIRVPYFNVHFHIEADRAIFDIHETLPLGRHRQMAFEYFMVELRSVYLSLMNPSAVQQFGANGEMWFMHDEPDYFQRYKSQLPECRFGKPSYRSIFDARQLDLPLQTANPETAQVVTGHCERELALLGVVNIVAQVRAFLVCGDGGYPSVEVVASQMNISSRTLKRKLQEHGITFTTLLEEVRKRDALQLLASPTMTVTEASYRMGYSNRINFSRAFRQWAGMSPSEYQLKNKSTP